MSNKSPAFLYVIYYENYLDDDSSEILKQWTKDSAYEAVITCLDPEQRADFFDVECSERDFVIYSNFRPRVAWGTLEIFNRHLDILRQAHRIQTAEDLSRDQAAHRLIVNAIETKRLS